MANNFIMYLRHFMFLSFFIFGCQETVISQDVFPDFKIQEYDNIYTIKGQTFYGKILSSDSISITFHSIKGDTVIIEKALVEYSIVRTGYIYKKYFFLDDPNKHRLFILPTGRSLQQGRGYITLHEIIFPVIGYGVHENLNLTAGGYPFGDDYIGLPFFFAPKFKLLEKEDLQIQGGYIYIGNTGTRGNVQGLLGTLTYGNAIGGVTVGGIFGRTSDNKSYGQFFLIGGDIQISRGFKVVTENWFSPLFGDDLKAITSLGVRFFNEHFSIDLAGFSPVIPDHDFFSILPWVNLSYTF